MSDEVKKYFIDRLFELFDINRYQGLHLIIFTSLIILIILSIVFTFIYLRSKRKEHHEIKKFENTIENLNEDSNAIKFYVELIKYKDKEIYKLKNKICELEKSLEMVK